MVVDDVRGNIQLATALLEREGYTVTAASTGRDALDAVARDQPDLILLDVMLPDLDGFEICRRLKADAATRLLPVVLLTARSDTAARIHGIEAGADDFITKPFNPPEIRARVRSLIRIKRYTDDLETAESVIVSLALTIEARDPSIDGHCQRLAAYAAALGAHIGLGEEDLAALERGGYLHDVGKVGLPDAVLLKPGPLTRDEYEHMKTHTLIGDRLCGELRSLRRVRPVVRGHHERLDGSGYPDGLRGDAIPLLAQIMGIVDVFDALTTSRPYKRALPAECAYEALLDEVSRGWRRRDLVDAFIGLTASNLMPRFPGSACSS
ncbi:MAG: response regulator [Acidobacteriia bacterium]|nr:response regulator [Terriglobia bacterium]